MEKTEAKSFVVAWLTGDRQELTWPAEPGWYYDVDPNESASPGCSAAILEAG